MEQKPSTRPSSCKSASPARTRRTPLPRYLDHYEGVELPLPQVTAEIEALPAPLRTMRVHNTEVDHDSILWSLDPSPAQLRRLWTHYLANVTMIDEQVGALLGALAGGGYLEDAVVIFTSDHGDCLGDHGQIQKWTMHDCITRVPFVVWSPNRFGGGRQETGLWQQMDLAPALLELAGGAGARVLGGRLHGARPAGRSRRGRAGWGGGEGARGTSTASRRGTTSSPAPS